MVDPELGEPDDADPPEDYVPPNPFHWLLLELDPLPPTVPPPYPPIALQFHPTPPPPPATNKMSDIELDNVFNKPVLIAI